MEDNSKIPFKAWYKATLVSFANRLKSTYEDSSLKSRVMAVSVSREAMDQQETGHCVKGVLGRRCGSSYHLADWRLHSKRSA